MKNLAIGTLLAASTVLAMVGSANAALENNSKSYSQMQQKGDGMSINKGPLSKINLTASQQTQIQAIREAKRIERNNNREQNKVQREQMRGQIQSLANASTLDTVTLNRLADQHAAQSKQHFIDRVKSQQAIAQVLTAEQRTQMQQIKAERVQRGDHQGRGGKGRNGTR